jgi:hypothetical protein
VESGTIRGPRNKDKSSKASERGTAREPLVDRSSTVEPWCPESLRGMRNAKFLSCRAPFAVPEGLVSLRVPLPREWATCMSELCLLYGTAVCPHGYPGDENYEERNSFFYTQDSDELNPYHPSKVCVQISCAQKDADVRQWDFRPTLPGPLPSRDDREVYVRDPARGGGYGFGGGIAGYGGWFGMGDPRV